MANPDLWTPGTVAKAVAAPTTTPAAIEQALDAQGMNASAAFGPGRPMAPTRGYSQRPRTMDYPVGVNIATGNNRAAWGRTSFDTLKAIIDAYDVARMCINHKIDELVSMEPMFLPAEGFSGDADDAIVAARAALEFPDRELPFETWLSKWLEGVFRYDAGALYRRRNLAGEVMALEVLDGTTLVPMVDEFGRRPQAPAPAFWQRIHGQDRTWLTADEVLPTIRRPQTDSPYGLAPMESVLLTVNTDLKHQLHFLQMFTDGNVPAGFMELPEGITSPDQVAEFQDYWDAMMYGDQAMLRQLRAVPNGTKITETRPKTFDTNFAEYLATRTAAAFGVVPQDLGIVKDVNLANGEAQTDMQFRVNTLPWVMWVQGVLSRYLRYDLGLPVRVKLNTGREKEDRLAEAQTWAVYVANAIASPDEARAELTGLPIDNENPMGRGFVSPRTGFVPARSVYAIQGPIDPETGTPTDTRPLDTTPFDGAGGVLPDKAPGGSQFKRAPIDPSEPAFPELEHLVPGSDVLGTTPSTKPVISDASTGAAVEAVQADADALTVATDKVDTEDKVAKEATAGVTSGTGITGVDLIDDDDEHEDPLVDLTVAKAAELTAFRRFTKARAKAGRWRDFQFTVTDPETAALLNEQAREVILGPKAPAPADPLAKSWRDGTPRVPQHAVDLRLVDYWTPKIADALAALITPAQLRAAIEAAHGAAPLAKAVTAAPADEPDPKDEIARAARERLTPGADPAALEGVVRQVIADGYLAGGAAARRQLGPTSVTVDGNTGAAIAGIDWDTWEPGDVDAAIRAADGGLAQLLSDAGVGIKGIVGSSLDDLGNAIADGVLDGSSVDDIASSLGDWASGFRAERIAQTESARCVDAATQATYVANGIAEFDVILSDGACDECVDVADGNPYPAGDSLVPIHPLCRCASSAHIPADWTGPADTAGEE